MGMYDRQKKHTKRRHDASFDRIEWKSRRALSAARRRDSRNTDLFECSEDRGWGGVKS